MVPNHGLEKVSGNIASNEKTCATESDSHASEPLQIY